MIGRDSERASLESALDEALSGSGQFVLVVGDAGMGKTELAAEVARKAAKAGAVVAWSRCWDAGGAPALWPWAALIRSLPESIGAGSVDDDQEIRGFLQDVLNRLSSSTTEGLVSDANRFALFESVDRLLADIARDRPLLLVFDDLHAADETSLQILRFVARSLRGRRILMVGTYLESEVKDFATASLFGNLLREARRIELSPLTLDAAGQLYREIAGSAGRAELVAELHAVSEGNPLLLREAAHSFATASGVRRGDHSLGFRVPRGARDILRRRLAPLPGPVLRLLAVAAVIGRDFDAGIAGEVAGINRDHLFDLLQTAIDLGVVREGPTSGTYSFSHVLLRETLYEDLRMSERMNLHARVVQTIERRHGDGLDSYVDQLAHHSFKAAQAGTATKTLAYTLEAAAAASDRGAYSEAVRLYQRALKAAELAAVSSAKRAEIAEALKAAKDASVDSLPAATEPTASTHEKGSLRRGGDFWVFDYAGKAITLKDSKGLGYLQRLLENPGHEIHVLELGQMFASAPPPRSSSRLAAGADVHAVASGGGEPVLDERAKQAYRNRIQELEADIDEASEFNDPERLARAQAELDAVTAHLAAAVGLGGRDRQASSEAERARVSVSKAIRAVLAKVEKAHPELGQHLRATIRTGFYCVYLPDPRHPLRWES